MRAERGAVLLEAVVALAILGTAALAMVASTRQATETVRLALRSEREIHDASAFLEAVALWPRADLERHLGDRPSGAWRLEVARVSPVLFDITVRDTLRGTILIGTTLFRRADDAAP